MSNSIILLPLLILAICNTDAFTTNSARVRHGRWATSSLRMSAVENSNTAEAINSRLEAQMVKLTAKDATSTLLSKEVS
jgi:hypothetical protein